MRNLIAVLVLMVGVFITGCDRNDEPAQAYYVRYTAIAKPNEPVTMYFTYETGKSSKIIQTSMPDGKFQYSVGPVEKGFNADLVVSYDAGGPVEFLSIEVAKGSEPFVIKKSGSKYFDLYYTIE